MKRLLVSAFAILTLALTLLCSSSCNNDETFVPETNNDATIWVYYRTGEEYKNSAGYTVVPGGHKVAKVSDFANGRVLLPLPKAEDIPEGHMFAGYYTYHRTDYFEPGVQVYDSDANLVDGSVFSNNTISLEAKYEPITYSFCFDAGEGSFEGGKLNNTSVVYGSEIEAFPAPLNVPVGHYFDGWFSKDGTRLSDGSVPVNTKFNGAGYDLSDTTLNLNASYKIRTLTVTLDYLDPEIPNNSYTVTYGEPLASFDEYFKDTGVKETVSWSLLDNPTADLPETVTDDLHFLAVWKEYKIVDFILPGGDAYTEKIYDSETSSITLPWFDVPGYRLISWHPISLEQGSAVTAVNFDEMQTTYHGKWQMTDYTLTFDDVNGQSFSQISYYYGDTTALPIPSVTGYSFAGWYTENPENTFYVIPETLWGDYTLHAKLVPSVYTVYLFADCKLDEEFVILTYGEEFFIAPPNKDGYSFLGWFDSEGNRLTDDRGMGFSPWTVDENEITLYARWKKEI